MVFTSIVRNDYATVLHNGITNQNLQDGGSEATPLTRVF